MKEPKIYFRGKYRTEKELYEMSEMHEGDFEILEAIDELENEFYEFVRSGTTWNGDDMFYTSYEKVRKEQISDELAEMKEFYRVNGG